MPRPYDAPMGGIDPAGFNVLTFDCYGTLIDWETGIVAALRAAGPEGWTASDEELLARFALHEAEAERGSTGGTARSWSGPPAGWPATSAWSSPTRRLAGSAAAWGT